MDSAQTEPMHPPSAYARIPAAHLSLPRLLHFIHLQKVNIVQTVSSEKNFISFRSNNIDKIIENDRELVESLSAELMERIKPFEYSLNA